MIVHLNGRYLPASEATVPVWDGGFMYGDGIYTTLRLYRGVPLDLPAHHARLVSHAAALDLAVPLDENAIRDIAGQLVDRNGRSGRDSRLRITISRGWDPDRPMPLDDLAGITPTVLLTLGCLPADLEQRQAEGISVTCLEPGFSRGNLPELKTLNGLPTLLALRRATALGCQEAIMTGPDGRLLEGAISNLFLVDEGQLLTPATGDGFLAGRTRERILKLASQRDLDVTEMELTPNDLETADEVFLAGSVREIQPVVRIDAHRVADGNPGPVTRSLQEAYRAMIERELTAH